MAATEVYHTEALVNQSLGLLRGRSKLRQLDTREMYVERVLIVTRSSSDQVEFLMDDLKLTPIVRPNETVIADRCRYEQTEFQTDCRIPAGPGSTAGKTDVSTDVPLSWREPGRTQTGWA